MTSPEIDPIVLLLMEVKQQVAKLETIPEDLRELKTSVGESSKEATQAKTLSEQNAQDIEEICERSKWRDRTFGTAIVGIIATWVGTKFLGL